MIVDKEGEKSHKDIAKRDKNIIRGREKSQR
jgi:hypothetical protein